MGITITEDELDKKTRQAKELGQEMAARHAGDTGMAEELQARDFQINRTKLVSRKAVKAGKTNTDPDPSHAHRLVNRGKDGEMIALRQGYGWETVPADDDTHLVMSANKDDCQVQGDLVLMRTPIANYEKSKTRRRMRWAQMSGQRVEQTKENLRKIARDGGVVGRHQDAVDE